MNRYRLLTVAAVAISFTSGVSGQVFSDDFSSYSNDAELTAVWERVAGSEATIALSNDPLDAGNNTVTHLSSAGRLRHTISPVSGLANTLIFSFDFYDFSGVSASGRTYGELRQSGSANGLLAAGLYNSTTTGAYSQSRYQARNLDDGQWIQLDAPRSLGWHNFRFEISGNSVDLYVDGVLDPQFSGRSLASDSYAYDWVHLGFADGDSATVSQFDNVMLTVVPEPSTYAAVFGSLTLAGAVFRRRLAGRA